MNHGWEYKNLGDVCEIKTGKLDANARVENGKYPFFTCDANPYKIDNYAFDSEAILISGNGSNVGHVNYYNGKFNAYQRTYVLSQIKCFNVHYLRLYLKGFIRPYIFEKKKGGCIPFITLPILENFKIPFPSTSIQEQIVAELDKINELIEAKRSQLADLDALAQSLFYETFGDPIDNPMGWESNVWENLFNCILGKMLDKNKQNPNDKSLPYLANQNVQWGYFMLDNLPTMTFNQNEITKFSLLEGDLLICEGGESGRCAVWQMQDTNILFQKAIHRARAKSKNDINTIYVRYWLEFVKKSDGLKNYITKSTIEHLTGEKLKKIKVLCPPIELQNQFADKIEAIEVQKQRIESSIADLETLLASRMDYWFND